MKDGCVRLMSGNLEVCGRMLGRAFTLQDNRLGVVISTDCSWIWVLNDAKVTQLGLLRLAEASLKHECALSSTDACHMRSSRMNPLSRGTATRSSGEAAVTQGHRSISVTVDQTCLIRNIKFVSLHPELFTRNSTTTTTHSTCSKNSQWASHRSFPSGKRPPTPSPDQSSLATSSGTSSSSLTRRIAT